MSLALFLTRLILHYTIHSIVTRDLPDRRFDTENFVYLKCKCNFFPQNCNCTTIPLLITILQVINVMPLESISVKIINILQKYLK